MDDRQSAYIMPEHVSRAVGRDAQRNNILAAKLVADIVKTTLGPKGMDKMLVDSAGNTVVTNDGVTILEEMELEHPAAKILVDIAKTQETEVGDGTTTVALLAGKLLEYAEQLLERNIHPTAIVKGYRMAASKAEEILASQSIPLRSKDVLRQIAMTAMTGKGAEGYKDALAALLVNAVERVADGTDVDSRDIRFTKLKSENIAASELIEGVVLQMGRAHAAMPSRIDNARILLIDFPLEVRSPDREAKILVSSPEQLEHFIESEERALRSMTEAIIATGARVLFCQRGIDDVAQYYLAQAGILACRRIPKSDLEMLARATSAGVISTLHELSQEHLGMAACVEEVRHGDEPFITIRGCRNPRAVTLLIRGTSLLVLDEVERALKDGLSDIVTALKSNTIVAGGGAIEIELARQLALYARTISGREQLAVQEFAHALESIPETLAENAGLDPIDILTELKRSHDEGHAHHGLNLFSDRIEDALQAGIVEPMKVKQQAIASATEAATLLLRIDDVLISKPRHEQKGEGVYTGLD